MLFDVNIYTVYIHSFVVALTHLKSNKQSAYEDNYLAVVTSKSHFHCRRTTLRTCFV